MKDTWGTGLATGWPGLGAAGAAAPGGAPADAAQAALAAFLLPLSPLPRPPAAAAAAAPGGVGVLTLSPTAVALAAGLIAVQALVSLRFHLGLHTQLVVAALRCVVQLSVLGYVLGEPLRLHSCVARGLLAVACLLTAAVCR